MGSNYENEFYFCSVTIFSLSLMHDILCCLFWVGDVVDGWRVWSSSYMPTSHLVLVSKNLIFFSYHRREDLTRPLIKERVHASTVGFNLTASSSRLISPVSIERALIFVSCAKVNIQSSLNEKRKTSPIKKKLPNIMVKL